MIRQRKYERDGKKGVILKRGDAASGIATNYRCSFDLCECALALEKSRVLLIFKLLSGGKIYESQSRLDFFFSLKVRV